MKKGLEPHQYNENDILNQINRSCPALLQQDITESINEQVIRNIRSHQFMTLDDQFDKMNQSQKKSYKKDIERKFGIPERSFFEAKIQVNKINKKGTDFDCQKVESVELSYEEESYRTNSINNKSKRNSQIEIEEPKSGKKSARRIKEQERVQIFEGKEGFKQDILNILIAGAEDTGKSTFIRCFKKKQRKFDEPHIKPHTRQIRYEFGVNQQNSNNRRNSIYFVDLPGFAENQQDKYLREIEQYAFAQWINYEKKPEDDRRIHCCLYFLRGPRIKDTDIYVMKRLSENFNLIPIIAKSDQYTKEQVFEIKEDFHQRISFAGQINFYDIEEFYRLRFGTEKLDEVMQSKFGKFPPFVISSSFDKQQSSGFVRKYPWGKVEIQNPEHTDFEKLCELLSRDIKSQLISRLLPPISERSEQMTVAQSEQRSETQPKMGFRQKMVLGSCFLVGMIVLIFKSKGK